MDAVTLMFAVIVLVIVATIITGWTDAPLAITTAVTTKVMTKRVAVMIAVPCNLLGTVAVGFASPLFGEGVVAPDSVTLVALAAALAAFIIGGVLAEAAGIPFSKSYALIAALAAATVATGGTGALLLAGWENALVGFTLALTAGAFAWLFGQSSLHWTHKVLSGAGKSERHYYRLQWVFVAIIALCHGFREGQLLVGFFTMALVVGGVTPEFVPPWWSIGIVALAMGVGTCWCSEKITWTLGEIVLNVKPWQGVAAAGGASLIIASLTMLHWPLSTTHAIVASIAGAGTSRSYRHVQWRYPYRIVVYGTVATFLLSGALAFGLALFF